MPDDDDTDTIIICAGPPLCGLEGYDAIMCQLEGCTMCRRIVVDHRDGSETECRLKAN